MGKVVVLKIANGDFERGFHVSLAIGEDGVHPFTEPKGQLPPAPDILRYYTDWQSTYRKLVVPFGVRLEAVAEQVTNYSDLRNQNVVAGQQLGNSMNQWLNSWEFSSIREKIKQVVNPEENVRFIVQTDDIRLQCLPWHLWNLWEDYHQSEIAFSLSSYNRLSKKGATNTKEQVRILAVFGESYQKNYLKINIEADWETLKSHFPDAELLRLDRPKLEDLGNLIWKEQFDIIFYSGHSYSEREGTKNWLIINEQQNIEIRDLKHAFQRSVRRGLQLAIFNSCDGLGIGKLLASWCIPQVIVMREPVPDYVAQKFLQYFLESYAHKDEKPFYLAVREARERLSLLEDQYPGATWLPVIFQNPAEVPLTWQELCYIRATTHSQKTSLLENNSNTISSIPKVRSLTNVSSPGENIVSPTLNFSSRLVIILAEFYSFIKAFMQGVIKLMFRIGQKIKRLLGQLVQQNVEDFPNPELSQKQTIETPTADKSNEDNAEELQVVDAVPKRPLRTLQEQIDSQPDNTILTLWPPNYEYHGPIVIGRSIILDGQGATICGHKGPILSIQSDRVILRNLRIEVTREQDSKNPQENCAILIKSGQSLEFHNVEVRGTVMGILEEEGEWKYPNPLDLGQLAHGQEYDLLLRIIVPVACKIASDISGLQFEPRNLTPGPNEIRLHIEELPKDTLINGSIFFLLSTSLKRRINLTAHIVSLQEERLSSNQNSIIWQPENWSSFVSVQELQSQPSDPESILVVSQNLTPILPSTESKIPPVYPQSQDEVQQGQTIPLRQPKIRRGEQLNNELFKLPDGSELPVDVQPDLNRGDNPQVPQVFIQNEETFPSQTYFIESTSIPAKKYQVGSAFSLPDRDQISKPDVDTKQDSPQLSISSLFLEQGLNSQQSLSNQDEVPESSTQVTPSSTPSSSRTRPVRSQSINPLFGQTLTPNQPSDKSNGEIKQESLQSNNNSQLPKRKIVSSNEISSLFEDTTPKKQPNE